MKEFETWFQGQGVGYTWAADAAFHFDGHDYHARLW